MKTVNKDISYALVASLILHVLILVGLPRSFFPKPLQVTPTYEVSLVRIKTPRVKIRRKVKKKIKKTTPKEVKPQKVPLENKKKKPVIKDEIKIAAPKKPVPQAPPPPAKQEPPPKPVSQITREDGAASQLVVDSPRFPFQFYVDIIHRKIMSNWFPDPDYVRPGSEVVILVHFRVQKTGEITELKLVSGSGEEILDKSAISAILSSKPLPPLPDKFEESYLGVNFRFILHGVQWENE